MTASLATCAQGDFFRGLGSKEGEQVSSLSGDTFAQGRKNPDILSSLNGTQPLFSFHFLIPVWFQRYLYQCPFNFLLLYLLEPLLNYSPLAYIYPPGKQQPNASEACKYNGSLSFETDLLGLCLNDNSIGPVVRGCREDFNFTVEFKKIFFLMLPSFIFTVEFFCQDRRSYDKTNNNTGFNIPVYQACENGSLLSLSPARP